MSRLNFKALMLPPITPEQARGEVKIPAANREQVRRMAGPAAVEKVEAQAVEKANKILIEGVAPMSERQKRDDKRRKARDEKLGIAGKDVLIEQMVEAAAEKMVERLDPTSNERAALLAEKVIGETEKLRQKRDRVFDPYARVNTESLASRLKLGEGSVHVVDGLIDEADEVPACDIGSAEYAASIDPFGGTTVIYRASAKEFATNPLDFFAAIMAGEAIPQYVRRDFRDKEGNIESREWVPTLFFPSFSDRVAAARSLLPYRAGRKAMDKRQMPSSFGGNADKALSEVEQARLDEMVAALSTKRDLRKAE